MRKTKAITLGEANFGSWGLALRRTAFTTGELTCQYDAAASRWDGVVSGTGFRRAYAGLTRALARRLDSPVPGQPLRVLDCGMGSGALSIAFGRALPAGTRLFGIDRSSQMLVRAAGNLRDHGLNASLESADIRALPFADVSFDVVSAAHVLEHLEDPSSAVQEMMRVLRPGGTIVLVLTRWGFLGALIHAIWRTHPVRPRHAAEWLAATGGTSIRPHHLGGPPWCRHLSFACTARKPKQLET